MATKKKTSPESETVAKATPATTEKKTTTRTAKAKSPAATHKAPARKPAVRKAEPVFDATAHHDEIAREAYFLFLNRGAHHGHEHEDWLRAVEIVKARYQG